MESQRSWIFRSYNRTKQDKNGKEEGLESSKLISTKEYEKCAEVFGLANYYRQFVKDFARIAKHLYKITRKNVKWNQKEKQQRAF